MVTWAAERGLIFSLNKTVSMIFSKRRKRNKELIKIILRNEIILSKENTMFLEMTLDTWEERKQNFLQPKEKHSNNKEAYTDGLKNTCRKVGFAAIFTDITRRRSLYLYS